MHQIEGPEAAQRGEGRIRENLDPVVLQHEDLKGCQPLPHVASQGGQLVLTKEQMGEGAQRSEGSGGYVSQLVFIQPESLQT